MYQGAVWESQEMSGVFWGGVGLWSAAGNEENPHPP